MKLFSNGQFEVDEKSYFYDPHGGKDKKGAFVLQPSCEVNPPIILDYKAKISDGHGLAKDFEMKVRAGNKPLGEPLTGQITAVGPNTQYYQSHAEAKRMAKTYFVGAHYLKFLTIFI